MKTITKFAVSLLTWATGVASQSLVEAISAFPELSNFTSLMIANPGLAGALLTSNASSLTGPATVLVPDNSAFTKLSVRYNISMGKLSLEQLEPYLEYHLLVGLVGSTNFSTPGGITVPSYLTGPTFNNRSAGAALGSTGADGDIHNGQVVFFEAKSTTTTANGTKKFALRQLQNPTVNAQGGLARMIVCHSLASFNQADSNENSESDGRRRSMGRRLLSNCRQVSFHPSHSFLSGLTSLADSWPFLKIAQTPSDAGI